MSKNRQLFGLFLVLSLVLFACSNPTLTGQELAKEDLAVYTAALKFEYKLSSLDGLVISQQSHATGADRQDDYLRTQFAGAASQELLANFLANNQAAQTFDEAFAQHPEITLLSTEEISRIFDPALFQNGWQEFYTRFPRAKGLITLSRIGYDRGRMHALVEVGSQSAPLAGVGEFLLLEKVDGTWQVQKNVMAWIS